MFPYGKRISKSIKNQNISVSNSDTYVAKIGIVNFRNYTQSSFEFPNCPIGIVGNNGIGKTNILEALSMFQPGRGIRSVRLQEMIHKNKNSFGLNLKLIKENNEYLFGTSFNKNLSKSRRVKLNGNLISPLSLTKYLGIVSLTPLMDKIFIESPSSRRRLMDKIVWIFISEHAANIRTYEKLIRERNNLLKTNTVDNNWFKNIEEQLVKYGFKIIEARKKVLSLLTDEIDLNSKFFPKASFSIIGEVEDIFHTQKNIEEIKEIYIKTLHDSRKADYYKGVTNFGPHRSDLEVYYNKKDMLASKCSTGEQKSILISIILSVCKAYKKYLFSSPILLLDEVFAHLDLDKKKALSLEIESLKIQVFMTGINEMDFMTFNKNSYIMKL